MAVGEIGYCREVREMVLVKRAKGIGHGGLFQERFVVLFFEIVHEPFLRLCRELPAGFRGELFELHAPLERVPGTGESGPCSSASSMQRSSGTGVGRTGSGPGLRV